MRVYRNKNKGGKLHVMMFGLVCIIDGLVRIFSLGFLHTNLPVEYSRRQAKRELEKLKRMKLC